MKPLLQILLGLCVFLPIRAQLRIDTSESVSVLVADVLLGKRVEVRNVRFSGAELAIGHFRDDSEEPLIPEGIVISTGSVFDLRGPNIRANTTKSFGRRGDHALESIAHGQTFDAAYLEFDFKPEMESVIFNFVFGSEEYTEFVNTQFNDVFAFYISGPGIQGTKNLAVIPKNNAPITVNTVNHIFNSRNYIDNNHFDRKGKMSEDKLHNVFPDLLETYELDGFTTLLTAETRVIPGKVYHIKISIADVSDLRYDSAVFLEASSFTSVPLDQTARASIIEEEYGSVKRKFQPMVLGEEPSMKEVPKPIEVESESLEPKKGWLMTINFDFDAHELSSSEKLRLDSAWNFVLNSSAKRIVVHGHTDNIGSNEYNVQLSQKRCEAVLDYLLAKGFSENRISINGFGFRKPISTNLSESGRALNRRVEIWLED